MNSDSHHSRERASATRPEEILFSAFLILLALAIFLFRSAYEPELMLIIYRGAGARSLALWRFITALGSFRVLIPVAAAASLLFLKKRRPEAAMWLSLGLLASFTTSQILKWLIARDRPPVDFLTTAAGFSFPSEHSAGSIFVYYYLWIILASSRPARNRDTFNTILRRSCSALLAVLPGLVGYSRIYLGVHWPSDVLGGWAVGLFVLAVAAQNAL